MSDMAIRNQRVLRQCQLARDFSEPPEYWDDEEEFDEDNQCPDCGGDLQVEGGVLICGDLCGWYEETEEEDGDQAD